MRLLRLDDDYVYLGLLALSYGVFIFVSGLDDFVLCLSGWVDRSAIVVTWVGGTKPSFVSCL